MNQLRPATDASAARWLLRDQVDWWDLVRYGPPGFAAYVRIAFPQEAESDNTSRPEPLDVVGTALSVLTAHTTTPDSGFAAIWEGWSGGGGPAAPRVLIPHRTMLLFTGPIEVMRYAPARAWYGDGSPEDRTEPHLVWPEDQAWCLACEVDEEIEFTVGCSEHAFRALATALPGAVRGVGYGEPAPLYRDEDA